MADLLRLWPDRKGCEDATLGSHVIWTLGESVRYFLRFFHAIVVRSHFAERAIVLGFDIVFFRFCELFGSLVNLN